MQLSGEALQAAVEQKEGGFLILEEVD